MPKLQHTCSLHENTVKTLAAESPRPSRRRSGSSRVPTSRVRTTNKLDSLHPMLRAYLEKRQIHPSRVEVRSSTEIVVR